MEMGLFLVVVATQRLDVTSREVHHYKRREHVEGGRSLACVIKEAYFICYLVRGIVYKLYRRVYLGVRWCTRSVEGKERVPSVRIGSVFKSELTAAGSERASGNVAYMGNISDFAAHFICLLHGLSCPSCLAFLRLVCQDARG